MIKLSDDDIKEVNQSFQELKEKSKPIEEIQEESELSVSSNTIEEIWRYKFISVLIKTIIFKIALLNSWPSIEILKNQ